MSAKTKSENMEGEKLEYGSLRVVPIGEVLPYEKNPRKIHKEGIRAVKESIQKYGYNVPIVVDSKMVVVTGHSRLMACKELGMEKVSVIVATHLTERQAKEFRIADNRTSELSKWDNDLLISELRDIGLEGEMDAFFKSGELSSLMGELDKAGAAVDEVTQEDIDKAQEEREGAFAKNEEANESNLVEIICKCCSESFHVSRKLLNY
jgi:ParB-like chromosome segregation protein Spo0J